MTTTTHTAREPWQKLRSNERCEACGHRGYCMHNNSKIYCMFPDGKREALHAGTDKAGAAYAIYPRTGQLPPTPLRPATDRPDWEQPEPVVCDLLYTTLATRCADTPTPDAAREADARRFGAHAEGVRAASDHFYIRHPEHVIAWLESAGRIQQAKNAGILTKTKKLALSPALLDRKVFVYRDEHGRVKDLRGRAYDGSTPKVRSLAGGREERDAAGTWYQHRQIAAAQGGHLRIAGGHEKADALTYAVGPTVGTNEGQASDGMIAALINAGIIVATIHADGEDPQDGRTISAGQRLAVALGERLEEAGIAVRVAEPLRSPGEPKLDADTILRDHGPEALRDLDRRAVPLAAYRRQIGDLQPQDAAQVTHLSEHVARLQEAVRTAREERDQARELNRLTLATLRAGHGSNPKMKTVGRCGLGLVIEWDARRRQGRAEVDLETGERWVEIDLGAAGENVGQSDDATGAALTFLCNEGIARKRTKWLTIENPAPDQYPRRKQLLVHFPQGTREAALAAIADLRPAESEKVKPYGGSRPRCDKHPDAGTKTTITRETICTECGEVLDRVVREEWHDAAGQRADLQPQDAGYKTYSEELLGTPEDPADLQPHLAVEPLPFPVQLPRCLARDCTNRVEQRGDRYCHACANSSEGYSNAPSPVNGYAYAVGDD